MAALRPGNSERAWNDPPVFAFDSGCPTVGQPPKRSVLSGRIRHPLPATSPEPLGSLLPDSTPSPEAPPNDEQSSPIALLPPARTTDVPPTCPVIHMPTTTMIETPVPVTNGEGLETAQDSETLQTQTLEFLEQVLHTYQDQLEDRVRTDVQKRLAMLSSSWKSGKLSQAVQIKMHELAKALSSDDVETANSLHLSLMVDYVSEVSQWMVGIKRLIHEMHERHSKKTEASSDGV